MFSFLKKSGDQAASAAEATPSWRERLFRGLSKTRAQWEASSNPYSPGARSTTNFSRSWKPCCSLQDVGIEATGTCWPNSRCAKRAKLDTRRQSRRPWPTPLTETPGPLEAPLVLGAKTLRHHDRRSERAGEDHFDRQAGQVFPGPGQERPACRRRYLQAAAREQLQTWGERNGVTVIAQEGGDPAAVIFDAIAAAKARGIDVVPADTAGRLPTQLHLMEEIAKVRRVIKKVEPDGPHETLLVLDANIGQNALAQVRVSTRPSRSPAWW